MVPYVLPLGKLEVREYLDQHERSLSADWSDGLNREGAAKVAASPAPVQQGQLSNDKRDRAGVMSSGLILALTTECTGVKTVSGS
jgi:hypothetical protein